MNKRMTLSDVAEILQEHVNAHPNLSGDDAAMLQAVRRAQRQIRELKVTISNLRQARDPNAAWADKTHAYANVIEKARKR